MIRVSLPTIVSHVYIDFVQLTDLFPIPTSAPSLENPVLTKDVVD